MEFLESIKSGYFLFEDKWYSVLDKINTRVPVYKVVDPVDRVIPSFILFLLIILFVLILIGYLIQFATPYDITIITHDSSTKILLSGVALDGELNGFEFSGKSDSSGEYSFPIQGQSRNFFGLIFGLFFPAPEPDFIGFITAKKDGYNKINRKDIDFTSTKHKIYLEAAAEPPRPLPNSTVVVLQDSSSKANIISSDSYAYVKFKCKNKNISIKTVRDDTDGLKDGKYTLSEEQCEFVVTKAFSTGYNVDSIQKILPTNKNEHIIQLNKTSVPTTGTAKVYIYNINTPDTNREYLDGIKVFFNSTTGSPQYAWTNASGVAQKTLEAGTYTITITDANYYEITSSDNITIDIEVKDEPTELSIGLEKIILSDRRQIYFKVVDSADSNIISDVTVDLMWLNKDLNGNYFGTDGITPIAYNNGTGIPSHTDSNGLFKAANVTVRKDGELVAILKKENYIYTMFRPTFFTIGLGPQVITMDLADETNSGKAKINVNAGDNNRPLLGAAAYLYDDLKIGGIIIEKIPFEKYGVLTNSQGVANYSDLPIGPNHTYSAEAKYGEVSSGFSSNKSLDANQTIIFNIHMNLDISYFDIELYSAEDQSKISTGLTSASVKLYTIENSDYVNKTLAETIEYKHAKFVSNGYDRRSRIAISVDINGYSSRTITIDGVENPLKIGENKIKFKLVPLSMLDGNVGIIFDGIYSSTDVIYEGNSSVLQIDPSQSYKLSFLAAVNNQTDFTKLLTLARTLGKVTVSNVDGMKLGLDAEHAFTCDTIAQDSLPSVHDDNYYFPTIPACNQQTGVRPQAGFKWNNPAGTYDFVVTMDVNSDANLGDTIKVQYRGKEKHGVSEESETELYELEFKVMEPLVDGVYFSVTIEEVPVIFNSTSDISQQVRISPNQSNDILIRVNNNTNQSFSGAKLSVYSHAGDTGSFDPASAGSGLIHFDDKTGPKTKVLNSNMNVGAFGSKTERVDAFPEKFNSSNWLVIVLEEGSNTTTKFVDAKAWGKALSLDAEFIAGIENQTFDGTVYPRLGDGIVNLTDVTIEVTKDCKGANTLDKTINVPSTGLDADRFEALVPGMYEYKVDCVYVTANAKDSTGSFSFDSIIKKQVMATSGSGRDPALGCVDVTDWEGETEDTDILWDENISITVRNNCDRRVEVHVETGLTCTRDGEVIPACINGNELGVGESMVYNITGKNANYNPSYPDFSDTIGLFPINVKARFVGFTGRARWVLADKINAHLLKEDSCFSLTQDSFDFIGSEGAGIGFNMNSHCQYQDTDEFFFPKAIINAFGFEISAQNTIPLTTESFDAQLIVTGEGYETYYTDANVTDYLSSSISFEADTLTTTSVPGDNYKHYTNVRFDLNDADIEDLIGEIYWAATKFQFQFYDKNPIFDTGIAQPYGAAVDGNITINYIDGSTATVTPRTNFKINLPLDCIGTPVGEEYCSITKSGLATGDANLDVGLFYVLIPKGKVDSIDISFIGGQINENLLLRVSPYLEYTKRTASLRVDPSGESNQTISLGTYSLYPIEGAEFYIKHINDLNNFRDSIFTGMINPRMYLHSTNPKIVTWIEQGYLKAKYVGSNISTYDDGEIELTMEKSFGSGINYSIVNVQDFVDPSVAHSENKEISGVR
jgi:hypothetical protein